MLQGVQGISDIITIPGLVNVDFADVKAIMCNSGTAMLGVGVSSGKSRAEEAAMVRKTLCPCSKRVWSKSLIRVASMCLIAYTRCCLWLGVPVCPCGGRQQLDMFVA